MPGGNATNRVPAGVFVRPFLGRELPRLAGGRFRLSGS